ncbi:hypothetical protein LP419_20435 [Massilia sp. H-1]|nr:hypothetical protein LP419_20435 [Massilia sp. H-1]
MAGRFTDWIFPFFLFIGGVSMAFSLGLGWHRPGPTSPPCWSSWPSGRR